MLFNSLEFTLFFPIVFLLYWWFGQKNSSKQNLVLVIASYLFYSWWDWRFLSLIITSSLLDYFFALYITKTSNKNKRKLFLILSLIANLGVLGLFKYFNFFIDSFNQAFLLLGSPLHLTGIELILPVGISFYTFQTLSYTIDVYNKKIKPETNCITFLTYVCFFPQLVAGPIERASNLLPQFNKKRNFNYNTCVDGFKQMVWGAFKKLVIADNCALLVNQIFDHHADYNGMTLFVGSILFAFQIYGDFSGYSDMAIGLSKTLGIRLHINFNYPYFSRNIGEFWRKWHISLSTWFRDYLYIPLGGSRGSRLQQIRNITLVFLISGLWHGANWTFVFWGLIHVCLFFPLLLFNRNRTFISPINSHRRIPSWQNSLRIGITFLWVCLAWIFFRSETITQSFEILNTIFSSSLFNKPEISLRFILPLIFLFSAIEWLGKEHEFPVKLFFSNQPKVIKWVFYYLLVMFIVITRGETQEFIYFQF